ncbi:oligosaccharide flippase family protein [Nocardioides zeae]|uniref:Oligosaccharide flippase family protein n=1 Tax=Nocardioides imazamoxiresistens TaxID=3231893 RepID=A0ABU3PTI8_9ACTN|nr:oligosaccharide flippase family protein [Nocardioides zeae]MDT9592548.1 oligosaccharide flippase family protein [Nocardioides zeae]
MNTALSKVAGLATGIAIARIVGPEEFGTFAVAFVALMAVLAFNDLGVSLAIVRWPGDPRRIAPTVTALSVASSAVLAAAMAAAAAPFATAMGAPGATGPVRLLALCVLVNGIVATPAALLQRELRQDLRLVADQVNLWLGAGVSLALAIAGAGAASLAVGRLVGAVVSGILLVRFSPLPWRAGWDPAVVPGLLRFGVPLAGASAVVFGIGFADQLVVGAVLGPTALGAYVLAVNLAGWPVQLLSAPLRQVTPPLFARRRADAPAAHEALGLVARGLLALAVPCCVALAVCADAVVAVVYGPAWHAAAEPLRWLALAAVARVLCELLYDYLVVAGRTARVLSVQAVWLVALVPAVLLGLRLDGLAGAALAVALVGPVVVLPAYALALRAARTPVVPVLRGAVAPLGAGLALALAVGLAGLAGAGDLVTLAVAAVATLAAWLLLLRRGHLVVLTAGLPGVPAAATTTTTTTTATEAPA